MNALLVYFGHVGTYGFLSVALLVLSGWCSVTYSADSDKHSGLGSMGENNELSVAEKRLRAHLNIHGGKLWRDEAVVFSESSTNTPIDLIFSSLMQEAKTDNKAFETLRKLAQANIHSPSISSSYLMFLQEVSHGSMKYGMSDSILAIEPFWIPELLRKLANDRSAWLAMARYGVTILDLVEPGSEIANRALLLTPARRFTTKYTGKALISIILDEARQNAKMENWQENYPNDEQRIEAALLYHTGATNEARERYEKMMEHGIALVSSYYRLARIYETQGDQSRAEDTIQAGLIKFPKKNSILLVTAAEYAIKNENTEDALQMLNHCLAYSPEYPPAHMLLAEVEAKLGNRDAAIKACANTAAYCYGWDSDYIKRIAAVLKQLEWGEYGIDNIDK